MLRSYLLVAIRNLTNNGVYSFINVTGLSIGLTCSILILLWVSDELSYDEFHANRDRISRLYVNVTNENGMFTSMAVPLPLWENIRATQPAVEYVVPTNWGSTFLITYGENRLYKSGYYTGEDFLKMFTFPVIRGAQER